MGTGTGTLMPIMPTLTRRWNRRAASPLPVNRAVPLPYGLALTRSMASSSESTRTTASTGPNNSSLYASISTVTRSSRDGPVKKPSS